MKQKLKIENYTLKINSINGFTIIELLVVIGILGLLLAIAIPSLRNYERNLAVKNAAKDLRSLLWEAQGYGLAPQDTDTQRYRIIVTNDGQLGSQVNILRLNDDCTTVNPTPVRSIALLRTQVAQIVSDKLPVGFTNRLAVDFLVGNVQGGKVEIIDLAGNPANCTALTDTGKVSVLLSSPTADHRYRVVINPGNNTIDYAIE